MVSRSLVAKEIDISDYLHRQKTLWNAIAIGYAVGGYISAIALLISPHFWLNLFGVLLLTHSLVISAYLSHELMHGTLFTERKWNAFWGNIMLWLNGGCYATFDDLAKRHIAHHVDRVDFSAFNLPEFLNSLPALIRAIILGLEWLYFPAICFIIRWRAITAPYWHPQQKSERLRTTLILLIRGLLFTTLAIISPQALVLYFLAYIGMVLVLRLMDAFQHTYEVFPVGSPFPKRDRTYEQANTFTTLISKRYRWLNLLLLNFGYHNAHHELMKCPWHSLPELDRAIFSGEEIHYLTLPQLLKNYHRFRVSRAFSGQGNAVNESGELALDTFYGAVGVSFLVDFI